MKPNEAGMEYLLDARSGVWSRPDYEGIAYSDGDDVEARIAGIVGAAVDLSVLSNELRQHCTDWVSSYHLGRARANIMRPFEADLRGDVLEIGAGCGAVTRYLGECGGEVLALEGSPRRAAIARSRTRDLRNVTVVTDRFDRFRCTNRFDVITLIGVLEYAGLFAMGEEPAATMLEQVRSLLKPGGKLVLAIENQLGLKYFAGSPEDHLGVPMYGLEGRYRNNQPRTYGRGALRHLLTRSGFTSIEFMAPFPDYKFATSIVTELGFSVEDFDGCTLASQSVRGDTHLPPLLAFSPELVWPILGENGLALDLSNSFLVLAGVSSMSSSISSTYAWHFSTERTKRFCKETSFVKTPQGHTEVQYRLLAADSELPRRGLLRFAVPKTAEYVRGRPFVQEFVDIVSRDGWHLEEIGRYFRRYLVHVSALAAAQGQIPEPLEPMTVLPGECFDYLPQNIIVDVAGEARLIDKEWELVGPMSVNRLVFRAAFSLMTLVSRIGACADRVIHSPRDLYQACFAALGFPMTDDALEELAREELTIHAEVSLFPLEGFDVRAWLNTPSLRRHSLTQAVTERDALIVRLTQSLAERDVQVASMQASVSWRITRPLRGARSLLKRCGVLSW